MESRPDRIVLRRLSLSELRSVVLGRGLAEYRYRQIARWLYHKGAETFQEMTDLSTALRAELAREFEIGVLDVVTRQESRVDGAQKTLFGLPGGAAVESVLMPTEKRITLCISSQVGCTLDCVFCQTGQMGFQRNLSAHEILGQVLPLWRQVREKKTRTNVVFMGMGEPLHNVEEVVRACRTIMDPLGLNLGAKRITVSTAGVLPGIRKLAESELGVQIAVSLNATTQKAREALMPRAAQTPLPALIRAARDYAERFRNRVTIEYVLIRGINDSPGDAIRLGEMFRGGPFKINLIPYNPGASPELVRPDRESVDAFARRLHPIAPVVTVRWSLGPDISAACGQLRVEQSPGAHTVNSGESGPAGKEPSSAPS